MLIIFYDSSFTFRFISFAIGIESFFNQFYLFGHGVGSINHKASQVALERNPNATVIGVTAVF